MKPARGYSLFAQDMELACQLLEPSFAALRGQSLFLTGCTAFLGKWIIDTLLWANAQYSLGTRLTVLARNPRKLLQDMPHFERREDMTVLAGGITDFDTALLPPFTLAVHAVNSPNDGTGQWAAQHMTAAAAGTERLYRLAAERGCQAVLLTSSGAVYGTGPVGERGKGLLHEEAELNEPMGEPRVYGETKRFTELFASALGQQYGIRTVLARCFAFSGAHFPLGSNALGSFVADTLTRGCIQIKGDGTPVRSFLYGADMAAWLLTLLAGGRHGVPYNVGSERGVCLEELARLVLTCAGCDGHVHVGGKRLQGNAPSVYVPDTSRARREFGLKEETSLEDGLIRMIEWHRVNK